MKSKYDEIVRFMNEYVKAYSEEGQVAENHKVMDKFYAPELSFDDMVTNREQWYETCLSHSHVQDKLTLEHRHIRRDHRPANGHQNQRAERRYHEGSAGTSPCSSSAHLRQDT